MSGDSKSDWGEFWIYSAIIIIVTTAFFIILSIVILITEEPAPELPILEKQADTMTGELNIPEKGGAGNPNPDFTPMPDMNGGNGYTEEIRDYHEDGTYSIRYKDHLFMTYP